MITILQLQKQIKKKEKNKTTPKEFEGSCDFILILQKIADPHKLLVGKLWFWYWFQDTMEGSRNTGHGSYPNLLRNQLI